MKKINKMLRKIKYTFLFIIVGALVFLGYFMSLDNAYKVTRERVIKAPAKLVYLQIADLKNWNKWSQFKEKDSTMQFEFEQSTNKEGDFFRFTDSNGMRQKLTNLTLSPDSLVVQSLSSNEQTQEFKWQIIPQEDGVLVRWTAEGELPFMQRIYSKEMDDMIGPQLTRGLELLDKSVQADMQKHETTIEKVSELSSTYYLYKSASCKFEDLGKKLDELLPDVLMYVINNHIEMNGKPFTIYNKRDVANNSVIFSSCMPTKEKISAKGDILTGQTPGGKYLKIKFQGDYKYLKGAWQKADDYVQNNGSLIVDATRAPFEVYVKGHTKSLNPADWITELYIPIIEIINPDNMPQ